MQKSKLQELLAHNLKKGFSAVAPTQWSDEQDALIWGQFSKLKYSGFGYPLLEDFNIGGLVFSGVKSNKEYEQFIEKNKKKTYARYTGRAVEDLGVKTFLENLIRKPETLGFKSLEEFNSLDISYEQVVLKHADEFDADVIDKAKERLSKHN